MNNIKWFITLLLCLTAYSCFGQAVAIGSKKAYLKSLETLFEEGRYCYVETGNKAQLKRVIDAYKDAIMQGLKDGMLTENDIDSLLIDIKKHKLLGDYHYLDADQDTCSFAIAEKHYLDALAITKDEAYARFLDVFYYQFVMHQELAQLYYKQERYKEAYDEMIAADSLSSHIYNDDEAYEFTAQLAMCKARIGLFDEATDDINGVISHYKANNTERYGEAIRKKAKILMLQQENESTGIAAPNDALKYYKEYFTLKKNDALKKLSSMSAEDREQYWMRIRPFAVDCYRLEDADPAFLYDVTLFSKSLLIDFEPSKKPQDVTWKKVQKYLQKDDCALEFIQYEKYGEKQMGALVLKKTGKPQFVKIGQVETIKNLRLPGSRTLYKAVISKKYWKKNELYRDSTIFQYIWTPELLNAIGEDTQHLYFSPDGLFHLIAIEYMLPEQAGLKPSNLYRLTSTRQLLEKNGSNGKKNQNMLAIGDIDFYKANGDQSQTVYDNDNLALEYLYKKGRYFDSLSPEYDETIGLDSIYLNGQVTYLFGANATEGYFAHIANQYRIIHISTHGSFGSKSPMGTDLIHASFDESLSQNVLGLSGSSRYMKLDSVFENGKYKYVRHRYPCLDSIYDGTEYDGILSAREIAQMDLSNVDLIVLSACQSGLGFLTDDGIYGLQRGLKSAGVKGIIVSLWSVDAHATSELMRAFYYYLQTEDMHTAFNHAREALLATCRDENEYDLPPNFNRNHLNFSVPEYTNAFILIDVR